MLATFAKYQPLRGLNGSNMSSYVFSMSIDYERENILVLSEGPVIKAQLEFSVSKTDVKT